MIVSLGVLVVFVVYMIVIIASHSVPLDSGWRYFPAVGMALLALQLLRQHRADKRPYRASRPVLPLLLLLVLPVAVATLVIGLVGTSDSMCTSGAPCSQATEWRMDDGGYSWHRTDGDAGRAWVPASEEEYVVKAGRQIRQGAVIGVIAFTLAFLASEGTRLLPGKDGSAESDGREVGA